MSRPYPVAPPVRQKIPVCEVPIPTSIKKSVPFFNPREFWSLGANPVGSNCRQLDTIITKPVPPIPLNVCTYAGAGVAGDDDGIVNLASFAYPTGMAVDSSGNMYIADSGNHKIKKIDTSGFVTTFAGTGISGFTNGSNLSASFWNPTNIAIGSSNTLYVADSLNNAIRKISNGTVTTFAGNGSIGSNNGTGTDATFNFPFDVTADLSDNLYIADTSNDCIRFSTSSGVVTRYAGQYPGFRDGDRLAPTGALFNKPTSVAINLSTGDLYVTDTTNNAIRVVSGNNVSTVLTNYYIPVGGSFDSENNYYFSEQGSNRIIKYSLSNNQNTIFAGDGTAGYVNSIDLSSSFDFPFKVCPVTPSLVYVVDNENNVIRRISDLDTPITEILTIESISPYQYSGTKNANLTYYIIGGGGGGAIGSNAGGGGGGGAEVKSGFIENIAPSTTIDFNIGHGGFYGLFIPPTPPRGGLPTFVVINGQTITSEGGGPAPQFIINGSGGDGGEGYITGGYGGGGGYGPNGLGNGGTGMYPGKNATISKGGDGGGIAPGIGGSPTLGAGGGGGGHGGGYGIINYCNAFYYGSGGGGINANDEDGNIITTNAGLGADGVIAFVFTPI